MRVEIPAYKHIDIAQHVDFNGSNICTLIGGNGSGKSTILESIFSSKIEMENVIRERGESLKGFYRCITFTSGQNELFSKIFSEYEKNAARYKSLSGYLDSISSFYFDYCWVKLLIFFATSLKSGGLVRNYLKERGYIDIEDNSDNSTHLKFGFRVRKYLTDKITEEHNMEESKGILVENRLLGSLYIGYLEKIINAKIDPDYSFSDRGSIRNIVSTGIMIGAHEAKAIFGVDVEKIFAFFTRATGSRLSNFALDGISLFFKNGLELRDLSDGEYQLLAIYALIDLFDNQYTIFLLDEVDSHLHHLNIHNLWDTLNSIHGKVIATSHLSGTILKNEYASIKFVQNGKINEEATAREVFSHIQDLTKEDDYYLKLFSKVQYIALLDDEVDWEIFKELACKKIGENAKFILSKVTPYKRHSSFNTSTEIFGHGKLKFIESFIKVNKQAELITQNIFCICDRDELPLTQIANNLEVLIHNDYKNQLRNFPVKSYLLSWKRREIENYLLSKTLLTKVGEYERLKQELPQVNFDNLSNFDASEDLRKYDSKALLHPLYKKNGFDYTKLVDLIDKIPQEEISEDIVLMYEFIKDKIERNN